MARLEQAGWVPLFPQGRLQPQLSGYLLHLACQQSSKGVYGSGSQSEDVSGGFKDMGGQGLKVLWRKGSQGLVNRLGGARGSAHKKPTFIGSAACRTLFFLWLSRWYKPIALEVFFSNIKNLGSSSKKEYLFSAAGFASLVMSESHWMYQNNQDHISLCFFPRV